MDKRDIKISEDDRKQLAQMQQELKRKMATTRSAISAADRDLAIRIRILLRKAADPSLSARTIASQVDCGYQHEARVIARFREKGMRSVIPKKRGRKANDIAKVQITEKLFSLREEFPDATRKELQELLARELSREIGDSTFRRYLAEAGLEG